MHARGTVQQGCDLLLQPQPRPFAHKDVVADIEPVDLVEVGLDDVPVGEQLVPGQVLLRPWLVVAVEPCRADFAGALRSVGFLRTFGKVPPLFQNCSAVSLSCMA